LTAVVRQAVVADVSSIAEICSTAYRDAYRELLPPGYIDRSVVAFYDEERVSRDVAAAPPEWFGYQVVEEGGRVLGAAGGGMTGLRAGELSLIYLASAERGRGLGTRLLERVTALVRAARCGCRSSWATSAASGSTGPAASSRWRRYAPPCPASTTTSSACGCAACSAGPTACDVTARTAAEVPRLPGQSTFAAPLPR